MSEKNIFMIYSLPHYKITEENYKDHSFSGTLDEVLEKLKEDKGYHIQIISEKPCLAYGDFDHTTKERFKEFLELICINFKCKLEDISVTKSKKSNEYSYHWVIPSIETSVKELKRHFSKPIYDKFRQDKKKKELDTSVYPETKRFFRLPNQTNGEKPLPHRIIRGSMKDFIVEHTDDAEFSDDFLIDKPVEEEEEEEEDEEEEEEEENEPANIEYVEDLLNKLDADICYPDWIAVGMALKNEGFEHNVFDEWSSKGDKYKGKKETKTKWDSFKKGEANKLNKIEALVKEYDIDGYNELVEKYSNDFIDSPEKPKNEKPIQQTKENVLFEKSFSGLEQDIADYIIYKYLKNNYVCVSTKEKKFFYFDKNRWVEDFENNQLWKIITRKYVNDLCLHQPSDEMVEKQVKKLVAKLKGKMAGFVGVIEWISQELFNPKFYDLCDNNIYLLGFDNGVFDTRDKSFREGKPDDYITKSVGYDFPIEEKGYRKDINKFLKSVFPDKEVRKYVIQQQAQSLSGMKSVDCVYTHTGKGSNGKSIEQEIMKTCFGDYYIEIPSAMLTKVNKMEHNKPDPFYAELKGVRYSAANEPSDGAKINDSLIKIMGSKEGIKYRTLFSNKVEKLKLQAQLHIYCNNKLDFNADDGGVVRRLKVIDYISIFTDKDHLINEKNNIYTMDVELSEKVKSWASDYMMMLIELFDPKFKYKEPKAVVEASGKYADSNNDVKKFVDEFYELTNNKKDTVVFASMIAEYKSHNEYDQGKVKDKDKFKASIQNIMNVQFIDTSINGKAYRNVCRGWRRRQHEDLQVDSDSDNDI